MSLIEITEKDHGVILELAYGTPNNFTGKPVYTNPRCLLLAEAMPYLQKAIDLAKRQQLGVKIFDAFRPQKASQILWERFPNPDYVAPPEKGSNHTRGIAVDLTLIDAQGKELDMGTPFDSFETTSHHGSTDISQVAQANRYTLLGIMTTAGWDLFQNEWWHYQLHNVTAYPLITEDFGMCSDQATARLSA